MGKPKRPPKPRFEQIERAQIILEPVDIENLISSDHRARLLWDFLGKMPLDRFAADVKAFEHSAGRDPWPPGIPRVDFTQRRWSGRVSWRARVHVPSQTMPSRQRKLPRVPPMVFRAHHSRPTPAPLTKGVRQHRGR